MAKLEWDAEAKARLGNIPFFVRKMARRKIEKEARRRGETRITVALMQDIKEQEHAGDF